MDTAEIIFRYFPELTSLQRQQFQQLGSLYAEWNTRINVISRRDIQHLFERHVLHSLGIARVVPMPSGARIMDLGTGGGFPGIPLAILYPDSEFLLLDSIGKKVRVAQAVVDALNLRNVRVKHLNVLEERGKFDYVVSRAVASMPELVRLVCKNIVSQSRFPLSSGLICLKGGDLSDELSTFVSRCQVVELSTYFDEDFFHTKKVVYLPL